jgi:hypothetical protein
MMCSNTAGEPRCSRQGSVAIDTLRARLVLVCSRLLPRRNLLKLRSRPSVRTRRFLIVVVNTSSLIARPTLW